MRRTTPRAAAPATGVSAGLLVASGIVPGTFARSLSVRSAADQGIVTGLSTGLHYLLTVGTQDALQAAAAEFAGAKNRGGGRRNLTLFADLAVIPVGLAVQRALPPRPGEPMARGLLRQTGWRLVLTGAGATLLLAAQAGTRALDARLGAGGRIASLPVGVPVGLGVAYVLDRRRAVAPEDAAAAPVSGPSDLRSLGVAGGVVGALAGLAYGEHLVASLAGRGLASVLPGVPSCGS